ncbi:hypothetical protein REPUB_Repub03eG0157600 [Reevesia pubescens]
MLSLIEEERISVHVEREWILESIDSCKLCLIGKLVSRKPVNKEAMHNVLFMIWKLQGQLQVTEVGERLFMFAFDDECEKDMGETRYYCGYTEHLLDFSYVRKRLDHHESECEIALRMKKSPGDCKKDYGLCLNASYSISSGFSCHSKSTSWPSTYSRFSQSRSYKKDDTVEPSSMLSQLTEPLQPILYKSKSVNSSTEHVGGLKTIGETVIQFEQLPTDITDTANSFEPVLLNEDMAITQACKELSRPSHNQPIFVGGDKCRKGTPSLTHNTPKKWAISDNLCAS